MPSLLQDLRYGARLLLKKPGFTLIVVVTLALGIGANTTIFSLLDTLFLKPLPGIAEQDRLVGIGMTSQGFDSVSFPDYRDYVAQNSTFAGIAAQSEQAFHLGTDKTAERINGALVTGNYFDVLGVKAAQGRLLQAADAEIEGAHPVAVISERLWRKHFAAADISGQAITLNSHPYTIIGLAPALQATKVNLLPLLKDAGGSFSSSARTRLRSTLVVAQIALSLLLLVCAGLFVRLLQNASAINVGFATENVLTARLDLGRQNYSEAQGRVFYDHLLERMRTLPGVQAASLAASIPLTKSSRGNNIIVESKPQFNIRYNIVTPAYLDTLSIPLLLGRRFTAEDTAPAPRVAIINETLARFAWPNENPIGKIFKWRERNGDPPVEVIGVARDTKGHSLFDDISKTVYLPHAQSYDGGMTLHLRTATKPEQMIAAVQQEIRALDPKLPIYNVTTLEDYRRDALSIKRIQAMLIGGFGVLALVLTSIGLYGVLSFSVAQRTPEIGIRMALGASRSDVLRLVVGQGLRLIAIGVVLGLAGALAATRVLRSLLFGVSATDPATFVGITVLLLLVALLACWIPARRATNVDPLIALRCE
jgi:putative ABC transport system permease protein